MIDWLRIVAHGLWVTGLALILAALSYHTWLAGQEGRSLRRELAGASFQRAVLGGVLLVSIGLSAISRGLWPQLLSAGVAIAAAVAVLWRWRAA